MDATLFHELLRRGAEHAASDALFKVGQTPAFRVAGNLHYLQGDPLRAEHTRALCELVLAHSKLEATLDDLTEYDIAYEVPRLGRYRVNIFRQRGTLALALRNVPLQVPTAEALGCSPTVMQLAELKRGLVLVVGAAGNGKSSTLSAMVGHLNRTRRLHIVTIEDPIEFVHVDQLSTISQREVGLDTPSYASALRAALRQTPDVILLGEIRDEETMDIALKAAETGHLVLSSLHTPDVARTVGRIVALTERGDGQDIRERLADNLKGVIAQRLLLAEGGGHVLTQEIMVATGSAKEAIRGAPKALTFQEIMERGTHPYGMQTFEMHVRQLLSAGQISAAEARAAL